MRTPTSRQIVRTVLIVALWLGLAGVSFAESANVTVSAERRRPVVQTHPTRASSGSPLLAFSLSGIWEASTGWIGPIKGDRTRMIQVTCLCVMTGIFFLMWGKHK